MGAVDAQDTVWAPAILGATFAFVLLVLTNTPLFAQSPSPLAPVMATTVRLRPGASCSNIFFPHDLDHTTTTADGIVRMFEANGSGLAIGDLDNDGDLDLVLGNHHGPNTLFWNEGLLNEGGLSFRPEQWGEGRTRAITIVDVDGDGWRDIVLTTNIGAVNYWRNQGNGTFERELLPGVTQPAYAINWGDLDADGDLDLVAAPYDAGFLTDRGDDYLLNGGSAVYIYANEDGHFIPTRLKADGQALALALLDLNDDGRIDILVGNDFGVPDFAFVQTDEGWQEAEPFAATAHSTMSFDTGDIDNDGQRELFATDMKPYSFDAKMMAAYEPLMAGMDGEEHAEGDPQIMENVLQVQNGEEFTNSAPAWNIDGTGWSWSSKFGDLDNDGYLDLYVVNGMIEEAIFAHMPDHELVEENQAFRNIDGVRFTPLPSWKLNVTRSGRSMSMADLDDDGDLDIVVNNLRGSAQIFENRLCTGSSLIVELAQPDAQNRSAIGARLGLLTDSGMLYRDVRAASGYLSGDPNRVHFGFPAEADLGYLEILWPDGAVSMVERLEPNSFVRVERR